MVKPSPAWKNRIVGYGEESPDQLLANPQNFRTHPKNQQDTLAGVLSEVGVVQNVIVNKRTGFVVDGHLRISLAMREQQPTVPVTYVDLSPAEESLILATLDPISAMATADRDKLDELLRDVSTGDAAVMQMLSDLAEEHGVVGYGGAELLTDPDEVPEPPVDPITRPGDLWLLGRHRLLCGDSTNAADVARLMGGEKADMVFTDPPYGVDYQGGTKVREKLAADSIGTSIYADMLPIAYDFSCHDAPLYLWMADKASYEALRALSVSGYEIRAQIVWNKNQAQFGALTAQYKAKHEPCFYAFKRGNAPHWYGPTNEVTVWDVDRAPSNDYHPTQKPIALAERAINNSSKPDDLVLDLFGGSGSTLIACEQTGRRCAMMELDPRYCDVIVTRWENATGNTATREPVAMAAD